MEESSRLDSIRESMKRSQELTDAMVRNNAYHDDSPSLRASVQAPTVDSPGWIHPQRRLRSISRADSPDQSASSQ